MALILTFAVAVFAVLRISHMVTVEEGPFEIFSFIRDRIDPRQKTWIGRGINCPLCVSFWLSLVPAVLFPPVIIPNLLNIVLLWFGIAGVVLFLLKVMYK
jgi:hypothetical protein